MNENQRLEPVSDMAKSYQDQARDMLKACDGCSHPLHACTCPVVMKAQPLTPSGKSMLAKAFAGLSDLVKSQVKGYTKKDGTVVKPFVNKVQAKAHPPAKHMDAMVADGKREFDDPADHEKLEAIADHVKSGNFDAAKASLNSGDTVIREHAFKYLHPDHASKVGMEPLHPEKAHADFAAKFGGPLTPENHGGSLSEAKGKSKSFPSAAEKAAKAKAKPQPSAAGKATGATPEQLSQMEDTLANDEDSTDQELVAFFVKECGIPKDVAQQAVSHRDAFLANATPEKGLLGKLMQKDATGKGGSVDAGAPGVGKKDPAPAAKENPGATPAAGTQEKVGATPADQGASAVQQDAAAAAMTAPQGDAPPQADSNAAGWDQLPDDENPKHSLSGFDSKSLGKLATMKPEHAKAHAHQELANRGLDAEGNWQGFDKAKALHAPSIPGDFQPVHGNDPDKNHFQGVKTKVLQAAAKGHLDLRQRARAELAGRGHDTQGSYVGFDKASQLHGMDGKTGLPLAAKKKPAGGGGAGGKGAPQQQELFKALRAGDRPMFFVAVERAPELRRAMGLPVEG